VSSRTKVKPDWRTGVALNIITHRQSGINGFQIQVAVSKLLVKELTAHGQFYQDGPQAFYRDAETGETIEIDGSDRFNLMLARFAIFPADPIYKYVTSALYFHARLHAPKIRVHRQAHFNRDTPALYVSDMGHRMYRITADRSEPELVENGTDDVLFVTRSSWEPFSYTAPASLSDLLSVLTGELLFAETALSADDQKMLIVLSHLATYFPDNMRTRVIPVFIGPPGSRKTTLMRRMGCLAFGSQWDVTPLSTDLRDLEVALTTECLLGCDNADSYVKGFADRLAIAGTGGTLKQRRFYTNNELVEYRVVAHVRITSRTPSFLREDVADRVIPIHLERPSTGGGVGDYYLHGEIIGKRDALMTRVLLVLRDIVAAYKEQGGKPIPVSLRMAEFGEFAIIAGRALGWDMEPVLRRLGEAQGQLAAEDDPLLALLDAWAAPGASEIPEIKRSDLCRALTAFGQERRMPLGFAANDARSFAQTWNNCITTLKKNFVITERTAGGGFVYVTIRRKPEAAEASK
jgi:hypothetical protein